MVGLTFPCLGFVFPGLAEMSRPVPPLLNACRLKMACGIQELGPRVLNRLRMTSVMRPLRTSAVASIAFILIMSIIGALIVTRPPSPLAAAERLVAAVAFRFLGPRHPPVSGVVVVGITEETLAAFPYRSPIDRGF
ncbi:MAG TPA: hypothetical protein VFG12_00975, partial [Rhodopila sp.]|nr:hypothetical protein [Rhodopila sp.]